MRPAPERCRLVARAGPAWLPFALTCRLRGRGLAGAAAGDPAGLRVAALPGGRHRPGERAGLRLARCSAAVALGAFCVNARAWPPRGAARPARRSPCRPASRSAPRCRPASARRWCGASSRQPLTLTEPRDVAVLPRRLRRSPAWSAPSLATLRCSAPPASCPAAPGLSPGGPGGSATSLGVLIAAPIVADADRPAARGVGAAALPGRPDAGAGDRVARRSASSRSARWDDERVRAPSSATPSSASRSLATPAAGAAAGAGGAARRVQRRPPAEPRDEMRARDAAPGSAAGAVQAMGWSERVRRERHRRLRGARRAPTAGRGFRVFDRTDARAAAPDAAEPGEATT